MDTRALSYTAVLFDPPSHHPNPGLLLDGLVRALPEFYRRMDPAPECLAVILSPGAPHLSLIALSSPAHHNPNLAKEVEQLISCFEHDSVSTLETSPEQILRVWERVRLNRDELPLPTQIMNTLVRNTKRHQLMAFAIDSILSKMVAYFNGDQSLVNLIAFAGTPETSNAFLSILSNPVIAELMPTLAHALGQGYAENHEVLGLTRDGEIHPIDIDSIIPPPPSHDGEDE